MEWQPIQGGRVMKIDDRFIALVMRRLRCSRRDAIEVCMYFRPEVFGYEDR